MSYLKHVEADHAHETETKVPNSATDYHRQNWLISS